MTAEPARAPSGDGAPAEGAGAPGEIGKAPRSRPAESDIGPPADAPPVAAPRDAARRFVGRVAQLDLDAVHDAVATWRETMRRESQDWFAAEAALAHALVVSGRQQAQAPLLIHVADAFAQRVWSDGAAADRGAGPAPEVRVRATEASGQYLATVAMLALFVRDHLEPSTFALLYGPFAAPVPAGELTRE